MRLLVILTGAIICLETVHGHYLRKFKTWRRPVPQDADKPLILTPFLEVGQIEEARRQAKVKTDFKNINFYSGYYQVDKEFDNNLFFYFFFSEDNYDVDPVILWLQGGPGAPAGYGLFEENGPFIVNKNLNGVELREFRWTKNQSVLYIDNPVGTGFSYTTKQGYAQNQTRVGNDLYEALIQFFTMFPELQKNDFFIVGESYAGKYVPAVGHSILKKNPTASLKIPLKGLATGNGLSDPVNQANYGDYLYQLGFVDIRTRDKLHEYKTLVEKYVSEQNWRMASKVFGDDVNGLISKATGVVSEYNYLQLDRDDEKQYWQVFIQDKLRDLLHIGNTEFNSGPVYDNLFEDIAKSVAPWISELLENYRFLMYNGQFDIICAYPMMINLLQKLNFSASAEYKIAQRQIWRDTEGIVGYYKVAGNLTELLLRDAGHMVPVDQPKRAYMMIYSFVRGMPFPKDL